MSFAHDKELGQHFMIDEALLARIAQAGEIQPKDIVLEIGSGTGALTKHILEGEPKELICIEIDKRLTSPDAQVTFIQGDAKEHIPQLHFDKVIANLPYHETEPQLISLLLKRPETMVLVVGESFAKKLFKETILGIIMRSAYDIELLEKISPEAFEPQPSVQSSLLIFKRKESTTLTRLLVPFYSHQRQKVKNFLLLIAEGIKTKKEIKKAFAELPKDLLEEQLYTLSTATFKRIYTFIKDFYL